MDQRSQRHSAQRRSPRGRGSHIPHGEQESVQTRVRLHRTVQGRLRGAIFGILYLAAGYLLGSASMIFDAMPLGIGLLCAATSHVWYILAGVVLAGVFHPGSLPVAAWVGIMALCILLRIATLLFIDTQRNGKDKRKRSTLFSRLFTARPSPQDTSTDYYAGAFPPTPVSKSVFEAPDPDAVPPNPGETIGRPLVLFSEHLFLRMLTGAVCGFAVGLGMMLVGKFHVYDLLGALCMIVGVPLVVLMLSGCFTEAGQAFLSGETKISVGLGARNLDRGTIGTLASSAALLTCVTYGARSFVLTVGTPYLTVRLSLLLAMVFTLTVTRRMGFVPGVVVALLCGLATHPVLTPVPMLCAMVYAPLRILSHRAGVLGGCTAAAIWCGAVGGMTMLTSYLLTILLSIPVYFVTDKLISLIPSARGNDEKSMGDFTVAVANETRADAHRERLQALSEAFSSLSELFYGLSSQLRRPRMLDLRRMCDAAYEKQCARCRQRDICWGAEYDRTIETATQLTAQLHTRGRADADTLDPALRTYCPYMETIVKDINARCARMTEALLKGEKTEVFAADYEAIGEMLSDAIAEDGDEYRCNREAADGIFEFLSGQGVGVQGVVVCGKRNCRVIVRGVHFERASAKAGEIKTALEKICGTRLSEPTFEVGEDHTVMLLSSEPRLDIRFSGSTVAAGAEEGDIPAPPMTHRTPDGKYESPQICGDHIALFRTDRACFYALISDGMGSGEDASFTSDICTVFLEKMLRAGNRVEISLRMLNNFVRSKNLGTGDECSATVDLMELDMINGHAVFAKCGAAPTYVVRGGTVYKLTSHTLPLGILKESAPQLLRFRMHPGDVVVMVSDGVTLGNDECPWLIDLLSDPMPESMDSLRLDILRRAMASGSPDDMSAIAIRVEDVRGEQENEI